MVDLRFILHLFVGHAAKRETIGLLNLESANTSNDSAAETTSGFELPPRYAASGYLADSKVGQTFGERQDWSHGVSGNSSTNRMCELSIELKADRLGKLSLPLVETK